MHPETNDIVYIGMGTGQRAWMMRSSGKDNVNYGHRSKEHYEWFSRLEDQGYTLADIVKVFDSNLNKENAHATEILYIKEYKPIFNRASNREYLDKKREQERLEAKELRTQGFSFSQIAKKIGMTTMSAWRMVNDQQ